MAFHKEQLIIRILWIVLIAVLYYYSVEADVLFAQYGVVVENLAMGLAFGTLACVGFTLFIVLTQPKESISIESMVIDMVLLGANGMIFRWYSMKPFIPDIALVYSYLSWACFACIVIYWLRSR